MSQRGTMTTQQPKLTGHLPALDGVRGLAILVVLLVHSILMPVHSRFDDYFLRIIGFGWSGVDLFFVLSGFLITGILYDAKNKGRYFASFYGRRLLRIFPLYYAFLFVGLYLRPEPFRVTDYMFQHQAWYWLYFTNILEALDDKAITYPMSITWSLSVEEQFYLIWPTVVLLMNRVNLMRLCVVICCVTPVVRLACRLNDMDPQAVYILTICRFDTMAIGSLIALAVRGEGGLASLIRPAKLIAPIAAVTVMAVALVEKSFHHHAFLMQTLGFSAVASLGGCVLIGALHARPGGYFHRFWCSRFLKLMGKHSFAMYLIHGPLQIWISKHIWGRTEVHAMSVPIFGQLLTFALLIVGCLAVSIAIWHLYEKHFLKLKRYFEYRNPSRNEAGPTGPVVALRSDA